MGKRTFIDSDVKSIDGGWQFTGEIKKVCTTSFAVCICPCGNKRNVRIRTGGVFDTTVCKQCRNKVNGYVDPRKTHGHTSLKTYGGSVSPMYIVWQGVRERCDNPNSPNYANYGGRGIRMCVGWHTFENFLADMDPRPKDRSIDRIDVNGSYTCGHCDDCKKHGDTANCRWATSIEQGRNKRNTVMLTHDGRTQSMSAWAEETGMLISTMWQRHKRGMSDSDVITQPIARKGPLRKSKT